MIVNPSKNPTEILNGLYLIYDQCGWNWWLHDTKKKNKNLQKQEKIYIV